MNLLNKIKILITLVCLFIFVIVIALIEYDKGRVLQENFSHETSNLIKTYKLANNYFKKISNNIFNNYISQPEILKILYKAKYAKNKNEKAMLRNILYDKTRPSFNNYKKLGVNIILFSFENNEVFLRVHKADRFGDNLESVRYSFTYVNSNKKSISGFEQGKISHAFRNIFPLYYNNEYLGSVDISFSSSYLQNFFSELHGVPTHFIINKSLFEKNIYEAEESVEYVQSHEHEDFLYECLTFQKEKELHSDLESINIDIRHDVSKNMEDNKPFALYHGNKDSLIIAYLPIQNIKGNKNVAYLVSYTTSPYLESVMYKYMLIYIVSFIILCVLGIISYFNIKQRLNLKKEIEQKTEDLEKQKDELVALVASFNKHVICSRTDLEGKITYVSDALCDISEYEPHELIGKPHNILRHPAMSTEVCEDLMDTLNHGLKWYGEVKNLKKNGESYWEFTKIERDYNSKGEHVGYYSVRQDITSLKELQDLKSKLEDININLEEQVNDRVKEILSLDKEIQDTQKEIVFTMGTIGEHRSKETSNHVKRVAEYSKLLAVHYGLSTKEAELLKEASPMHDIGKVGIPDSILNKPSEFTEEEKEIMNTHTQLGYNMLKHSLRPLLKTAATIAHEHHERWDGSGYPRHLKGEDIHIYGRITAIADVFDALGSDRVYKKAWEIGKILSLFKEEKGKQFDPKLVDVFFENFEEFLEIRNRFHD